MNMENMRLKQYEDDVKRNADSVMKAFVNKILLNKESLSAEDIIYSDARRENELRDSGETEKYESTQKSVLNNPRGEPAVESGITGYIAGKKITISTELDPAGTRTGTIDGQKITNEDAQKIFNKYFYVAKERTARLSKIAKEKANEDRARKTKSDVEDILK